jgi:PadR family transcriptional regulator PadR
MQEIKPHQYLRAHLIPRASMLDIPFSSRYQAEVKKKPFIDGVPELLLLRLLAQNEIYGYELVAKFHSISDGAFSFGEGCIYSILHRLVGDRCLSIRKATVSGCPRRYYRVTAKGNKRLSQLEDSWSKVSAGISKFGKDSIHATA